MRNLSQAGAFGPHGSAKPGDTLEYRIYYENTGTTPVNQLVIYDTTPPATRFLAAFGGPLPAGLRGCSKITPANAAQAVDCGSLQADGGGGPLRWAFDGPLDPGRFGWVGFQVKVAD